MVHDFIQHYFFRPPAFPIIKHEFNLIRIFKLQTYNVGSTYSSIQREEDHTYYMHKKVQPADKSDPLTPL